MSAKGTHLSAATKAKISASLKARAALRRGYTSAALNQRANARFKSVQATLRELPGRKSELEGRKKFGSKSEVVAARRRYNEAIHKRNRDQAVGKALSMAADRRAGKRRSPSDKAAFEAHKIAGKKVAGATSITTRERQARRIESHITNVNRGRRVR